MLSLGGLMLVPSQVLEPKFGARSIAFSPKTLPAIALTVMALLGVLMALATVRGPDEPSLAPPEGLPQAHVLVPIAVMVAFVALIDQIGLIAASGLGIAALAYVLGNRNALTIVALAVTVPAVIWLIFAKGLKVFLPEGRLLEGLL